MSYDRRDAKDTEISVRRRGDKGVVEFGDIAEVSLELEGSPEELRSFAGQLLKQIGQEFPMDRNTATELNFE